MGEAECTVDVLDKGVTHVPGRTEQDGEKFHHTTQNSMQFKTYVLFISGVFLLMLLDLTETVEGETMAKGGPPYYSENITRQLRPSEHHGSNQLSGCSILLRKHLLHLLLPGDSFRH